jgi:hypothetical protein
LTSQINAEDAVCILKAAVSNETVPHGDEACILFGCIRALEIFVHNCADRVDR